MPEPTNDQPAQQPVAEPQAMEWLYDTMDQKDPERGPSPVDPIPALGIAEEDAVGPAFPTVRLGGRSVNR